MSKLLKAWVRPGIRYVSPFTARLGFPYTSPSACSTYRKWGRNPIPSPAWLCWFIIKESTKAKNQVIWSREARG
jgi:hypothetical protein